MTVVSWNVAGLRAAIKRGCYRFLYDTNPDVILLQEVKAESNQLDFDFPGYNFFLNSADTPGYSGTALLSKEIPVAVHYDTIRDNFFGDGRVITAEYPNYFVVCVYTPNTGSSVNKLDFRVLWDREFREFIFELDKIKPVIIGGDFNVVHMDFDCYDIKTNRGRPMHTNLERYGFDLLLGYGFLDALRIQLPTVPGIYSCWSSTANRDAGKGMRLDYFLLSASLRYSLENIVYCPDVWGSDHCPVFLEIKS